MSFLDQSLHLNVTPAEHERFLAAAFYHRVGYFPNLRDPKTFNEKVAWMRLNWTSAEVDRIVEKADFKDWVEERIGPGYTPQTYGVYTDPWKIDFDALPDSFMMKSTRGIASKQVIAVKDKATLDAHFARLSANEWLQSWHSTHGSFSCWNRGNQARVIIEELLLDPEGRASPRDYKFFCFNGEPRLVFTVTDRSTNKFVDFFDLNWARLPIKRLYANSSPPIHPYPPPHRSEMIEIARNLSNGFAFARVDLYDLHDRVVVGEIEFAPGGGLEPFEPVEWDRRLGELINLDILRR